MGKTLLSLMVHASVALLIQCGATASLTGNPSVGTDHVGRAMNSTLDMRGCTKLQEGDCLQKSEGC